MPGVLQIEAMAQTAGAVVIAQDENYAEKTKNVLFMSVDGVKFRRQVKPGDQLRMHVERTKARRNIFVFKAVATTERVIPDTRQRKKTAGCKSSMAALPRAGPSPMKTTPEHLLT